MQSEEYLLLAIIQIPGQVTRATLITTEVLRTHHQGILILLQTLQVVHPETAVETHHVFLENNFIK